MAVDRGPRGGDKDSAAALAKSGDANLHLVLVGLLESQGIRGPCRLWPRSRPKLEAQMCSLVVLAKPQLIPRASWISLCLRVELDPGELARKYEDVLIREIVDRTGFGQKVPTSSSLQN